MSICKILNRILFFYRHARFEISNKKRRFICVTPFKRALNLNSVIFSEMLFVITLGSG
jgi:hypothetical protein